MLSAPETYYIGPPSSSGQGHRPFTAKAPVQIRLGVPVWGCSSAGRALEWHSRGQGFDSPHLHHFIVAGWSSLVARRAHNPKVVGSNPAPATIWRRSSVGQSARLIPVLSLVQIQSPLPHAPLAQSARAPDS
jgi:hypothetical protein